MKIPKLNRRVHIQSQSSVQDDFGQPTQAWITVYSCWANVDIVRGQLIYNTGEFVSKATQIITIRYTSSQIFTPGQRIVYTDQSNGVVHTYELKSILDTDEANVWLQFLTYEINGDA